MKNVIEKSSVLTKNPKLQVITQLKNTNETK